MNTSFLNKHLSIISRLFKIKFTSVLLIAIFFFSSCHACTFESLSLEEKIGQLFMVHFNGEVANDDAKTLIQKLSIGGIIYYNWSNGLHSKTQVKALSNSLQNLASNTKSQIPLLIAIDQEGGRVTRLTNGFAPLPSSRDLGETKNPKLAKTTTLTICEDLKSVGINMNLSPVVDIDSNKNNPVIGARSFGNNPEIVIAFGFEALSGYQEAGIISCLKHFPGHGDTKVDSHCSLPVIKKSLKDLEEMELLPFKKLANNADCIMTAHLLVPALDPDYCSTLSEKTLNYLKDEIGFKGVIVSDSLVMEGVLKTISIDEAAILAFNAGCDIILLGGKQLNHSEKNLELSVDDIKRICSSFVQAVKSGQISEEKVDLSVKKILTLKNRLR